MSTNGRLPVDRRRHRHHATEGDRMMVMKLSLFSVAASVAAVLTSVLIISWSESAIASRELLHHQYDDDVDYNDNDNNYGQYYKHSDNGRDKQREASINRKEVGRRKGRGSKNQKNRHHSAKPRQGSDKNVDDYNITTDVQCGISAVPKLEEMWDPNSGIVIHPRRYSANNSSSDKHSKKPSKRIFGGIPLGPDMFPWLVQVSYAGHKNGSSVNRVVCSGTLISMSHVLTYRECFLGVETNEHLIAVVTAGHIEQHQTHHVQTRRVRLRSANRSSSTNHMAVLELKHPFEYNNHVRPICLPPARENVLIPDPMKDMVKENLTIIGFGAYTYELHHKHRNASHSKPLAIVSSTAMGTIVKLSKHELCSGVVNAPLMGNFRGDYDEMAFSCAFKTTNSKDRYPLAMTACHQDEGAPGMFYNTDTQRWTLYGIIVSTSINCDVLSLTVFNRVDAFKAWIYKSVKRSQLGQLEDHCGIHPRKEFNQRRRYDSGKRSNRRSDKLTGSSKRKHDNGSKSERRIKNNKRIFGGKKAKKGELPWIVRLDTATKSGQMCTGTILNSEFILTAGHCYKPDFISASVYEYQNVEQSRTRKEVYQHPDYKVGSDDVNAFYGPNLALIQLNRPLEWNEWTAPACLPPIDRVVEGGTNITIAGHGAIANDINGIDKVFDYPDMPHIGNTMVSHGIHCDYPNLTEAFCSPNKFRYPDGPDPNKFFFTSACAGDSGGPALHRATMDDGTERWEVYGVVSTTESKLCTAATTYYMLVPHVREWIFDTIVNKGTIAY